MSRAKHFKKNLCSDGGQGRAPGPAGDESRVRLPAAEVHRGSPTAEVRRGREAVVHGRDPDLVLRPVAQPGQFNFRQLV